MSIESSCRESASKWNVSAAVHQRDFIFHFLLKLSRFANEDEAVKYYFDDGRKSAELLRSILENDLSIDVTSGKRLLEFASGYGAITRHLHAVFPAFDVTSSDIHPEANNFIIAELGRKAIQSSSIPESFDPTGEYDLVFALSFFSHMPKSTWFRWISALFEALCVGGSLIFTTHGATTMRKLLVDVMLDDEGFYFRPESEQEDLEKSEYGTTVTSNRFVIEQLEKLENCELSLIRAGLWFGHQDLYVATKVASTTTIPVLDSSVYQSDGRQEGYVDTVFIIERRISAKEHRIIRATGWATPDPRGDKSADGILVLVRSDDGSILSCEATRHHRPDVAGAFGNPFLLETGFAAEVDITDLSGKLTLLLATRLGKELRLCRNISIPLESVRRRSV